MEIINSFTHNWRMVHVSFILSFIFIDRKNWCRKLSSQKTNLNRSFIRDYHDLVVCAAEASANQITLNFGDSHLEVLQFHKLLLLGNFGLNDEDLYHFERIVIVYTNSCSWLTFAFETEMCCLLFFFIFIDRWNFQLKQKWIPSSVPFLHSLATVLFV